jgi:hypothetical protein
MNDLHKSKTLTDTQNPQVNFGVFQSFAFMKVIHMSLDIKETPKMVGIVKPNESLSDFHV